MELSAKYARTVWEKKSFSVAARAMFVSQPALSATVAKLEGELGFKIFDRSTSPISLTLRGRIYMDYLDAIYQHENTLKQRLCAVDDISYGSLTVGGRMYTACYILPVICGEFYRKYPNINVTVDMNASQEKIKSGTVDLMISFNPDIVDGEAIPFLEERLFIAIRKDHPCAAPLAKYALTYEQITSQNISPESEITDLSIFRDVPFIKTGSGSNSEQRLSQMIQDHKVSPYIIENAWTFEMRYRIMQGGIGATLVSDMFLSGFPQNSDEIYYFALKDPLSFRPLYILRQKSSVENRILDKFVEIALECCQNKKLFLKS